jgi:hypothetical protein
MEASDDLYDLMYFFFPGGPGAFVRECYFFAFLAPFAVGGIVLVGLVQPFGSKNC